jgi:hypothetical protein
MEVEEKTSLILTIIFAIILLGGFFSFGYFLGKRGVKVVTQVCPPSLFDSKILRNWVTFANGEVKEISGRDLILEANGETLKISIPEGAKFQSLNSETKEIKEANFEDVKVGYKLEIQLSVTPEKKLIGHLITIMP